MRDLSKCSGPWAGFYIQGRERGVMALRMAIRGRRILARGIDICGPFDLRGSYEPDTQRVRIHKIYPWLRVLYGGTWDGQMIAGRWKIPNVDQGVFELWPLDEEQSLSEWRETLALPESTTLALPAPGRSGYPPFK
jgi:hypothetical protein